MQQSDTLLYILSNQYRKPQEYFIVVQFVLQFVTILTRATTAISNNNIDDGKKDYDWDDEEGCDEEYNDEGDYDSICL